MSARVPALSSWAGRRGALGLALGLRLRAAFFWMGERRPRPLENARVEPVTGVQQGSYTAPDGRIIYRTRVGWRTVCRRSGSVGLGIAGARGVNEAGNVSCPKGVQWQP